MNSTDWYQPENSEPRQWYSIQNKAETGAVAEVEIYDDIIPFIGVNAADFRSQLQALGDGIETIDLHIHSRGGSVWEAVAIMNTLRQHKARVVTTVDSIAASSAGFIAVGASDELIMAENAELMAHLPWAMAVGSAEDMRKAAESLDRTAKNIVSIFAERTGGSTDEWMQILTDETWWSADEAVNAGIADRVLKAPKRRAQAKAGAKNSLDLSIFNHAGRSDAPAPRVPQAHNETPQGDKPEAEKEKEPIVGTLSESALQKLGLDADADDSAIEEAINTLAERPTTVVNNSAPAEPSAEDIKNAADKFGLTVMDKEVRDQLIADAKAGAEARAQQVKEANDRVITEALSKGKIGPANSKTWREALDGAGREQTIALLESLPENSLPVTEIGHGVSSENSPEDKDKTDMFAYVTGVEYGKDL